MTAGADLWGYGLAPVFCRSCPSFYFCEKKACQTVWDLKNYE